MGIGQDLLDVPFPDMVMNLAFAIAKGQQALDRTSLETARRLARETVELIPEIHEIIEPDPHDVTITGPAGAPVTIPITGAKITAKAMDPQTFTLLQAGLMPTFYQFTESLIEVKISISMKTARSSEFSIGASLEVGASWGWGSAAFSSSVNYKTSNTYSYSAEGSSLLRTTLRPVPPPARLTPRIVTVNTFPLYETPPRPVEVTTTG
jgi:hypothetical protein